MKKLIFVIITLVVALLVYVNVNAKEIVIPSSSIRFRVIANSNSFKDQKIKMLVKEYIDEYLSMQLFGVDDINIARDVISNEIVNIDKKIEQIFIDNNYNKDYKIHYGENFFPEKLYKGINYESGIYESLVITIGAGEGDNWWCVLFPPLCLLDAKENEIDNIEYQFFVKELLKDIFE